MLERPLFKNINQKNIDEIIIFDGNKLKYHIKRYITFPHQEGGALAPDDIWTREEWYRYVLFEFNNDGDEIRQTGHWFNGRADVKYERIYLEYDDKGNWIYSRERRDDEKEYYDYYKREIEYKN
jgi:hypothetical protein